MKITRSLAFILTSGMFCISPAMAEEACTKPLRILEHLPMTPHDTRVTVPIGLNGTQKQFLVDTGGSIPQVSAGVVDEINLPKEKSRIKTFAVNGDSSDYYANADVTIGD